MTLGSTDLLRSYWDDGKENGNYYNTIGCILGYILGLYQIF